jgi:hypothetical protein
LGFGSPYQLMSRNFMPLILSVETQFATVECGFAALPISIRRRMAGENVCSRQKLRPIALGLMENI